MSFVRLDVTVRVRVGTAKKARGGGGGGEVLLLKKCCSLFFVSSCLLLFLLECCRKMLVSLSVLLPPLPAPVSPSNLVVGTSFATCCLPSWTSSQKKLWYDRYAPVTLIFRKYVGGHVSPTTSSMKRHHIRQQYVSKKHG